MNKSCWKIYYGPTSREPWDETRDRQAPPSTFYEQTKMDAHQIALQYQPRGLPLVIVCPATVVGPNDHSILGYFLRMYLNRLLPFMAWAPEAVVSGLHVDDVAEGIALAAEKGRAGETYLLAGDPVTKRDIIRVWMSYPGGMKVRFYMPGWMASGMFAAMEPLLRLAGLPAFMSREAARSASLHYAYSGAKAQRMQRIIDNLLSFSRLSARPVELAQVDLNQVLQNVLAQMEAVIHSTGADVRVGDLPILTVTRC